MSKQRPWFLVLVAALLFGLAARLLSQGDTVKVGIAIALSIGAGLILIGFILDAVRHRKRPH
jgi:hypothetical protein